MFNTIVIDYAQIETSMDFHFLLSKWELLKNSAEHGNNFLKTILLSILECNLLIRT